MSCCGGNCAGCPGGGCAGCGGGARDSVYAMREKNIMTGKQDNKFCPKDGYTAEQAVVTMERMYQAGR